MGGCGGEVMLGSGISLGTGFLVVVMPQHPWAAPGPGWFQGVGSILITSGSGTRPWGGLGLGGQGSHTARAQHHLVPAWDCHGLSCPPQPQRRTPGGTACKVAGAALCPSCEESNGEDLCPSHRSWDGTSPLAVPAHPPRCPAMEQWLWGRASPIWGSPPGAAIAAQGPPVLQWPILCH